MAPPHTIRPGMPSKSADIRSLGVFTPGFLIRGVLRSGPSVHVKEKVQKKFQAKDSCNASTRTK